MPLLGRLDTHVPQVRSAAGNRSRSAAPAAPAAHTGTQPEEAQREQEAHGSRGDAGGDDVPCSAWLFVGLGARGLLYHAWLAQQLAAAIVHEDEGLLPPQTRAWQRTSV